MSETLEGRLQHDREQLETIFQQWEQGAINGFQFIDELKNLNQAVPIAHFQDLMQRWKNEPPADIFEAIRREVDEPTDHNGLSFAIDSEGTKNADDAISYNRINRRFTVTITDASHLVWPWQINASDPTGGNMQRTACRSAMHNVFSSYFSNYLFLPMLPFDFTAELMSLKGELWDGEALLFSFVIDDNGFMDPKSVTIELAKVPTPKPMQYKKVQGLMNYAEQENQVCQAQHTASNWKSCPLCTGNHFIAMYECIRLFKTARLNGEQEDVYNGPNWVIGRLLRNRLIYVPVPVENDHTNAADLVSECMIATNHATALFCNQHNFDVLYRGTLPDTQRFGIATNSMMHDHLYLDGYCPVTNPIRKAVDLLNHMYIKIGLLRLRETNTGNADQAATAYANRRENIRQALKLNNENHFGREVVLRGNQMTGRERFKYNLDEWVWYVYFQRLVTHNYPRKPKIKNSFRVRMGSHRVSRGTQLATVTFIQWNKTLYNVCFWNNDISFHNPLQPDTIYKAWITNCEPETSYLELHVPLPNT